MLALAVLALSRPYFSGTGSSGDLRVIILDASASMQSTDESPSRFEKARAEALQLVNSLKDRQQAIILLASANTVVKQSATSSKADLRRALEGCQVTDSSTRLTEALKLAATLLRDQLDPNTKRYPEIHLFSDGAAGDLSEFENRDLNVVYHRVGHRSENLGITTLDIRENPENRKERAIYTSVANYSSNAVPTTLELLFDGQSIDARPITVPPGQTFPLVFTTAQQHDGVFTVRIDAKDDLAADNQASAVSLLPRPANVLLVTAGNRFLERALRAGANVNLTVVPALADDAAKYDIVVLDNIEPPVWPKPNVLAVHIANDTLFPAHWTNIDNPPVVDWKNTHPLLRYINFDNVEIASAIAVKAPTWGIPLVEAPQTPLILAGELNHQRIVWIAFDTLQSTWPLRISFPMFIENAAQWLDPNTTKAGELMLHAGEPFRLALAQPAANADVTFPDGKSETVQLRDQRELFIGDTAREGVYHVHVGTNAMAFCVNVLDAAESDTKPRADLQFGKFQHVSATSMKEANVEMWRWIAAIALAVLSFEWWFFHRRTA